MVSMLASASNAGDAAGWVMTLLQEIDGDRAISAQFTAAGGPAETVKAIEDFGFPLDEGQEEDVDISSDMFAALGCGLLFEATAAYSPAEAIEAEAGTQATVDAGALSVVVDLMEAWPDKIDLQKGAVRVIDSLTGGSTPAAQKRKLAALEAHALPAVLDTVRAHRNEQEVQEYGLGALSHLVGLDEAHRQDLTDAGDEASVVSVAAQSQQPRTLAFDGGAIELAAAALRAHGQQSPCVAVQAITLLSNLAMGPDAGAQARKEATRAVLEPVEVALCAHPTLHRLQAVGQALARNLQGSFNVATSDLVTYPAWAGVQ